MQIENTMDTNRLHFVSFFVVTSSWIENKIWAVAHESSLHFATWYNIIYIAHFAHACDKVANAIEI